MAVASSNAQSKNTMQLQVLQRTVHIGDDPFVSLESFEVFQSVLGEMFP